MPETAASASGSAQGAGEQAQEKAKEVGGQAQERAREAGQQVRGRMSEQVDQRSTQAGEQLKGGADDVRSFAGQLREQGKGTPARYVEQAADRTERLGEYLERSDGDRILHDVEDFSRRNAWAVAAGGVALGFAVSRLLKASSSERYRASLGSGASGTASRPRSERELGGPTTPIETGGGATGARQSQFEPHV